MIRCFIFWKVSCLSSGFTCYTSLPRRLYVTTYPENCLLFQKRSEKHLYNSFARNSDMPRLCHVIPAKLDFNFMKHRSCCKMLIMCRNQLRKCLVRPGDECVAGQASEYWEGISQDDVQGTNAVTHLLKFVFLRQ